MVSVDVAASESVAGSYSSHSLLSSGLVVVLGSSMVITMLIVIMKRRWGKHQNAKVEEYLKKSDFPSSDFENRITIEKFLNGYESSEDDDEEEVFNVKNPKYGASDEVFTI